MSAPAPDWSLLPSHPLEFFGLAEGFDERTLKRAYNRLIRQFKPERCPSEFQRIREAYERLSDELTFGATIGSSALSATGFHAAHAEPSAPPEFAAPRTDLAALLGESSPAEFRDRLRAIEDKTAREWGVLAVVEDELAPDDPLKLYDVLVEAIQATEGDLLSMLAAACREPLAPRDGLRLVQRLARLVENGLDPSYYYYLTAPLWIELVREAPFTKFAEVLEACRRKVGPQGFQGYVTLLIGTLRAGAYRADEEWLEEAIRTIAEVYNQLPQNLQYQVDVFDFLDQYRRNRGDFPHGSVLSGEIDRVLELIATGEEVAADRAFLELVTRLVEDPDEAHRSFPEWNETLGAAYRILAWYSSEVEERRGGDDVILEERETQRLALEFLNRLQKRTDRSLLGRLWGLCALGTIVAMAGVVLAVLGVAIVVTGEILAGASAIWLKVAGPVAVIALVGLTVFLWRRGVFRDLLVRVNEFFTRRIYRGQWRPDLIRFFEESHVSYGMLMELLPRVDSDRVSNVGAFAEHVSSDPSVALHSLALQFTE